MQNPITAAYTVAQAADAAWSAELRACFGRNAGDMRYQPAGRGAEGSMLRDCYNAFIAARDAWHAAVDARRAAS